MKKFLKSLIKLIPFKKNIFEFLKIFWKPEENIYRHLYFNGPFNVKIDETHQFKMMHYGYQLENEIFWRGVTDSWEKESIKQWIKLCKDAKVVFDIGANTGIYSLVAKAINPQAEVYAFEPIKRIMNKLRENNSLNNYDIEMVELAASNTDGTEIIFDFQDEHAYSVTFHKEMVEPGKKAVETEMKTIKLDTYIKQNGIERIDLIKIDVEAHEPQVIEGFKEFIPKFKPTLLIEILYEELGVEIEKMIAGLDYMFFNISENGKIRQVDKIGRSDEFNYLLCQHDVAKRIGLIE